MAVAKKRPKAAIQRGAFATGNTLPKVMGLGALVMDSSFVVMGTLLQVVGTIFTP